MAVSVILAGVEPGMVRAAASPLAELTAHLHAITEVEHHPRAEAMANRVRAVLGPAAGELDVWSPLWTSYASRFLMPASVTTQRNLEDELTELTELPLAVFAENAAHPIRGGNSGPPLTNLLTDTEQQRQLSLAVRLRSSHRAELVARLLADPEAFRTDLVDFLHRMATTWFGRMWRELAGPLGAETDRLTRALRDRGLAGTLATLSPTATIAEDPQRVIFDKLHHGLVPLAKRPCLIVPSVLCWPHLTVKHEPGWPVVIQYPVQLRVGARDVSLALLRGRLQALADPARLRLCRLIAREAMTTAELAVRSGMTEPQVSRHLRTLRDVDLVHSTRDGRLVHYQLDLDAVRVLGNDLITAIFR